MKLNEIAGNSVVVYHGDNYGTRALQPKLMMQGNSNNEVGVGIYFSPDKDLALGYGDKISQITITNNLYIVDANKSIGEILRRDDAENLMMYLHQNDEDFWYLLSDYVEVTEPENVDAYTIRQVYEMMKPTEIRNFQIELTQASNVETFVTAWNKFTKIDGLYEADRKFYAIINPSIPVTPVNF